MIFIIYFLKYKVGDKFYAEGTNTIYTYITRGAKHLLVGPRQPDILLGSSDVQAQSSLGVLIDVSKFIEFEVGNI